MVSIFLSLNLNLCIQVCAFCFCNSCSCITGCQLVCRVHLKYEIIEQFDSSKTMHSYIGIVGFSCYLGYMEAKAKIPPETLSIICGVWPFFSLFTEKNCLEIYFKTKSKSFFIVQGLFQVLNDEKPKVLFFFTKT